MNETCTRYVRDLFYSLRELASEARCEKARDADDRAFHEGREMAYLEVLAKMQALADTFMIERVDLGLANYDPLVDDPDPNAPSR